MRFPHKTDKTLLISYKAFRNEPTGCKSLIKLQKITGYADKTVQNTTENKTNTGLHLCYKGLFTEKSNSLSGM
jgi:hypothetical protein